MADKAYDSNGFIDVIRSAEATPVIPPRACRIIQRPYDKELYKSRNLIERFIGKLKHFRRIATRYEKYADNFLAMIYLASSLIILRSLC